jgi:hypothetical protein
MNDEILDLLLIPGERDFPAGQMAARRDALVAVVAAETQQRHSLRGAVRAARGHITRTWLGLIALLALGLALLVAGLSGYQSQVKTTSTVLLTAAGTAQIIAVIASPSALGSVELGGRRILLSSSRHSFPAVTANGLSR